MVARNSSRVYAPAATNAWFSTNVCASHTDPNVGPPPSGSSPNPCIPPTSFAYAIAGVSQSAEWTSRATRGTARVHSVLTDRSARLAIVARRPVASPAVTEEIAERVRRAIGRTGATRREVAAAIGLDETKLAKSLGGRRRFTTDELAAISRRADVPLAELVHGERPAVTATPGPSVTPA